VDLCSHQWWCLPSTSPSWQSVVLQVCIHLPLCVHVLQGTVPAPALGEGPD
jgi:hypothetical protein